MNIKPTNFVVLGNNSFSCDFATYLSRLRQITGPSSDFPTCSFKGGDIVVFASNEPTYNLFEEISNKCLKARVILIPVTINSLFLQIGPVLVPGKGGCWHCWRKRKLQHRVNDFEESLEEFYKKGQMFKAFSYVPSLARLAAGMVVAMSEAEDGVESKAGHIWQMNVFTREVNSGLLIEVNACGCCRERKPSEDLTFERIRKEFSHLIRCKH